MSRRKFRDRLRDDVTDYMQYHSPCTANGLAEGIRPKYKGRLSAREVASLLTTLEMDGLVVSQYGTKPKVYSLAEVSE